MAEESKEDRHNRELIELLNELRVALPGVQVLFAFLLAVPFANGFPKLGKLDRDIFFVAFIATALSTVLLIAPSSYHRLRWFVITDFLFHRAWAATFTAFIAACFLLLWYGLPLAGAIQDRRKPRRSR